MRLETLGIYKIIFLSLLMGACSQAPTHSTQFKKSGASGPTYQHTLVGDYYEIWRAIQIAMAHYPIRINDQDAGIIETDYIRGNKMWNNPWQPPAKPSGRRYKISVKAQKMSKEEGKIPVLILVNKDIEMFRDFFSEKEKLETDGYEESSIIYRIERELNINEKLKRLNK